MNYADWFRRALGVEASAPPERLETRTFAPGEFVVLKAGDRLVSDPPPLTEERVREIVREEIEANRRLALERGTKAAERNRRRYSGEDSSL